MSVEEEEEDEEDELAAERDEELRAYLKLVSLSNHFDAFKAAEFNPSDIKYFQKEKEIEDFVDKHIASSCKTMFDRRKVAGKLTSTWRQRRAREGEDDEIERESQQPLFKKQKIENLNGMSFNCHSVSKCEFPYQNARLDNCNNTIKIENQLLTADALLNSKDKELANYIKLRLICKRKNRLKLDNSQDIAMYWNQRSVSDNSIQDVITAFCPGISQQELAKLIDGLTNIYKEKVDFVNVIFDGNRTLDGCVSCLSMPFSRLDMDDLILVFSTFYPQKDRLGILIWFKYILATKEVMMSGDGGEISHSQFDNLYNEYAGITDQTEERKVDKDLRLMHHQMNHILDLYGSGRLMTLYSQWKGYLRKRMNDAKQEAGTENEVKKYQEIDGKKGQDHLWCKTCKCKIPKSNDAEKQKEKLREHENGRNHKLKMKKYANFPSDVAQTEVISK